MMRILGVIMKKFLVVVVLISLGCAEKGPEFERYQLEKAFFKAQKIVQKIYINPRIAPITDFEKAKRLLLKVAFAYDSIGIQPDTSLVRYSLLTLAQLEIL